MSAFTVRLARFEDERAVSALSANIWEGEDYVPRRFGEWVEDDRGRFLVACEGDTLVGFNKLTRLGPREWWMEGMRVDPQHRGRGIARLLHHEAMRLVEEIGNGFVRLATSQKNVAIHKLAAETGFSRVTAHALADVTAGTGRGHRFRPATPDDEMKLRRWMNRSPAVKRFGVLLEENWKWLELFPRLAELLSNKRVFWWHETENTPAGLVVVGFGENVTLWLNYMVVARRLIADLATDLRAMARSLGMETIKWKPLAEGLVLEALESAGWRVEPDFVMWVFERQL